LRLLRTSCYVFFYSSTFAFCHGCVLAFGKLGRAGEIIPSEALG
jgi:hypothetical protein